MWWRWGGKNVYTYIACRVGFRVVQYPTGTNDRTPCLKFSKSFLVPHSKLNHGCISILSSKSLADIRNLSCLIICFNLGGGGLLEYSNVTCFQNPHNLYESQFGGIGIIFSKSWKRENHLQIQYVTTFIGNSRAMNLTKLEPRTCRTQCTRSTAVKSLQGATHYFSISNHVFKAFFPGDKTTD